ncbi:flavodoxin family protein [Paenibacillus sp. HN-1]|uniref:flavodoxin family protein n=1 Tax=Paenibacillus TaxID=44249 RepID=UPI001CA93EED|nr:MULTISPECIES: flavodoxin family protein [Paenibacillus]MBY9080485.1 flavodoxin family protein [Paenibacillus sp. CGMCC 1.18879]MBY9084065.1 flavodoxin family protein [Paenibacillus sinensis]
MTKGIKIVGVISSARAAGNTAELVRTALKGAEAEGASVSEIFLAKHKLGFCTGCLKCTAEGICPLPDDLEELRKLVYEADGIIVGSPTYASDYNGILKNFYERLGVYTLYTSSLGGKYVVGISTSNGNAAKKTAKKIVGVFKLGIFQRSYVTGTLGVRIMVNGEERKVRENEKALKAAFDLGRKVTNDAKKGEKYLFQNLLLRLIVRLKLKPFMRNYIMQKKDGKEKATYHNLKQRGLI